MTQNAKLVSQKYFIRKMGEMHAKKIRQKGGQIKLQPIILPRK